MYQFSLKTGFYNVDAQKAGEYLTQVHNENGEITPAILVEKGKDESNIFHKCFEWNDGIAANRYRMQQAKYIICNVTVKYVNKDNEESETRAFVNVSYAKGESKTYHPIQESLQNDYAKNELLQIAKADAKSFAMKYNTLKEFEGVINGIKEVLSKE